ncbi:MAG: hypothetical protein AB1941_17375 [Gemmatimonadota bacterium]
MTETSVTVVRCGRCGRSSGLTLDGGRFWCARCQDWAALAAERVCAAAVDREGPEARLVPVPPQFPRRQPLRVPPGWLVRYNQFYEVDPGPDWLTLEDQLQATHEGRGRMVDVDWRRDDDSPDGTYRVVVHAGDFRGDRLHTFRSPDRLAVVAEVERVFALVEVGRM